MLNELSAAYKAYADAGGKVNAQTSDWIRAAVEAVLAQRTEPAPAQDAAMEAVRYAQSEQGRQIAHDHPDGATRRAPAQESKEPCLECWDQGSCSRHPKQPVPQSAGAEDLVHRMRLAYQKQLNLNSCFDDGTYTKAMTAALAVARPVVEAEARKGLHSEAEIEKAIRKVFDKSSWSAGEGREFAELVLTRLNAPEEERVTVEQRSKFVVDVSLDGRAEITLPSTEHAEIYATGLRVKLAREGKL